MKICYIIQLKIGLKHKIEIDTIKNDTTDNILLIPPNNNIIKLYLTFFKVRNDFSYYNIIMEISRVFF